MRGFPRYVDAVTGQQVRQGDAGAVFSGVVVPYSVGGSPVTTWVPVPADKVGTKSFSFGIKDGWNYGDVEKLGEEIRAKEKAAKKLYKLRPTTKQSVPGVTETYRNAAAGVDLFLEMNAGFIQSIDYTGAEDEIRSFIDGFQVRRGRARKDGSYSHTRLVDTKKGREIVDAFRSGDEQGAREFLIWLFSRNRGKRWREVDWAAVDALGDILAESCDEQKERSRDKLMSCTGWTWYPPGAELRPLKERLDDLTPKAKAQLQNQIYTDELTGLVGDLRRSLKKAKDCLPPQTREVVKKRIAYLAKMAKEPWRVDGATICGADPESGYQFCGFPAIEAEVVQLRKTCEFGYVPDWPLAEGLSEQGAREFGLPVATATGHARPAEDETDARTLAELDAIPWASEENPDGKQPPAAGTLDDAGRRMLWTVYEAAKKHYRKQGERGARLKQLAARVGWAEVKRHYFKRGAKWQKRKHVLPREPGALDLRQGSLPLANPRKAKKNRRERSGPAASSQNPARSQPARNPYGQLLDLRARVVELEVELANGQVQVHTWNKDRPALFWSEKKRALVWVHGGKDPAGFVDDKRQVGAVAARHRKWHGAEPSELGTVELPAGPLANLGPALRIVYFAERYRDGKPRHHDFGAGVVAYATKGRGARVFECRGGRLTLNDRGLVF